MKVWSFLKIVPHVFLWQKVYDKNIVFLYPQLAYVTKRRAHDANESKIFVHSIYTKEKLETDELKKAVSFLIKSLRKDKSFQFIAHTK